MRLDPATGEVLASVDANGHTVHRAVSGDIFVASLAGSVLRFTADWPEGDSDLDERDLLAATVTAASRLPVRRDRAARRRVPSPVSGRVRRARRAHPARRVRRRADAVPPASR